MTDETTDEAAETTEEAASEVVIARVESRLHDKADGKPRLLRLFWGDDKPKGPKHGLIELPADLLDV